MPHSYLKPSKKLNLGQSETSNLPDVEKYYFSPGFVTFGLVHLLISCNKHMITALLDTGASYNFIALPQLKQFAPHSRDWRWAKPLQVKLSEKSSIISLYNTLFLCNLHLELLQ